LKRKVCIIDGSIATGLGDTLEENWKALCDGKSAIAELKHFSTENLEHHKAACVKGLHEGAFENRILELAERAIKQLSNVPENSFVIWTGVKENVEHIESKAAGRKYDRMTLPNEYRQHIANQLKLNSGGMEINAACASSTVGIAMAAQLISEGKCSSAIVCAADIVSRFVFTGFSALKALSPTVCRPFDEKRDGLALGDGAAAIVLMATDKAIAQGLKPMAEVSGWGIANDANHITGPARDGCGLSDAINATLKMADASPSDIEAFCAHGTGTVYNDGMELSAIENIFGKRKFPIFSIKGAIGHTLGAAGAIEALTCAKAISEKTVPPTAGLKAPEARAQGRASQLSQTIPGKNILTSNSGFGGINAALLLTETGKIE